MEQSRPRRCRLNVLGVGPQTQSAKIKSAAALRVAAPGSLVIAVGLLAFHEVESALTIYYECVYY